MPDNEQSQRKRILDPMDRMIEAIYGIVMVLTFTCTMSAVESTRTDVRSMMLAAIGCNVAWGLVDGIMYLVARVTQQMRGLRVLEVVRESGPAEGGRALEEALPSPVVSALDADGMEGLRLRLKQLPAPLGRIPLSLDDWLGAVGIFLIAVVIGFPVLLPFLVMNGVHPAMRVSNGIALLLLFVCGEQWARMIGLPRWRVGVAMALGGTLLVGVTIALGG